MSRSSNSDSDKFTGRPLPPGYLEPGAKGRNLVKFNIQAIGKAAFRKGQIVPSKSPITIPVKPGLKYEDLVEVRIIPKIGCYVIEVVYECSTDVGYGTCNFQQEGIAASDDSIDRAI